MCSIQHPPSKDPQFGQGKPPAVKPFNKENMEETSGSATEESFMERHAVDVVNKPEFNNKSANSG